MAAEFLFMLLRTPSIPFGDKKFLLRRVTHELEAGSKRERQSGYMMYDDRKKKKKEKRKLCFSEEIHLNVCAIYS